MLKYFVAVCVLAAVLGVTTAANVTTCYYCDSVSDKACDDPFDDSKIKPVECSSLIYARSALPDSTHKLLSIITNAEQLERADDTFTFGCIKINAKVDAGSLGEVSSIARTCIKKFQNIDDICEYFESQSSGLMTINSCNYCETNNCNSGVLFKVSGFLMGVILIFFMLY